MINECEMVVPSSWGPNRHVDDHISSGLKNGGHKTHSVKDLREYIIWITILFYINFIRIFNYLILFRYYMHTTFFHYLKT